MTSEESDVKMIAGQSPSFDGSIANNFDPMQTLQKELERGISGVMQRGKMHPLTFEMQKRMKRVTSSSRENARKISKQFLLFGVILIHSPCHYYDVKKKNSSAFTSQKMRTHVTKVFCME